MSGQAPALILTLPTPLLPAQAAAAQRVQNPALVGLSPPLVSPGEPSDVLGMLMALMERLASQGVSETSQSIRANQNKLAEAMDKFRAKMEEIARKAEKAEKDDGWGFLGDICSAVCDFVGDIAGECFGTLTEVSVDWARGGFDVIIGLCKGGNLEALLNQELQDLTSQGDVSETIKGATRGVTDFYRDALNAYTGMLEDIAAGKDVFDSMKDMGTDMWNSFVDTIIENEDVMEVLGTALKVAAVGAAVASGGLLGLAAAGLFALSTVDQHTGLCNEVFGEEAGPWVSLGISVAAAVCLGFAGTTDGSVLGNFKPMEWLNDSGVQDTVSGLRAASSMIGGALAVGQGVRAIQVGIEQKEAADDSADLMKIMNLMAAIQRTIDALLSEAEEKTENRDRIREGGAEVYRLEGQSLELAVSGLRA